jgi:penicillin-binding protein 1A
VSPGRSPTGRVDADAVLGRGRRRRRRARRRHRFRRRLVLLALVGLLGAAVVLTAGAFTGAAVVGCDLNKLRPVAIGQNSFVYAADGSLLGSIPAERNRQPVPLGRISPVMRKATVAIEDRRFYEHGGVDFVGIARALAEDIKAGKVVQGGSTITQQLVRNLYISRERTLKRKLTEACLAIKLSRRHSHAWILRTYMNTVYYGNHAYGIEAAAQTYFSRHARSLTLAQAALLAGLPQAPSVYDPFHRPQDAIARRDEVLRAMLANGDITPAQYADVLAQKRLHLRAGRLYSRIREPYFFGYVRDQLIAEYGADRVRSGGLRVYTTINRRYQRAAIGAIKRVLYYRSDPAAAIVAIDPRNGWIRAMTAYTPGKRGNQFNFVAQARRQAGSTFKTFVLTAAVNEGINPATTSYLSAPLKYDPSGTGSCDTNPPTAWCPQTFDHSYLGSVSIERGTLASDNTVYARLTLDVGPAKVAAMAYRLGVRSSLKTREGAYVPSMGLGAIAVSPLDMASAYATLAAGGIYSKPLAIRKVVLPTGEVDTGADWGNAHRRRVISEGVAYEVTRILSENMRAGTGVGAYFGVPSAGKTGTTDNFNDAWFCGYTPRLEATVWIGYPKAEIPMLSVHGIAVSGPTFPATIWRYFMESSVDTRNPPDFAAPSSYPTWRYWRGKYQYSGGYYDSTYSSSSSYGGSSSGSSGASSSGSSGSGGGGSGGKKTKPTPPAPTPPPPTTPTPTTPAPPPPTPPDTTPTP